MIRLGMMHEQKESYAQGGIKAYGATKMMVYGAMGKAADARRDVNILVNNWRTES